MAETETNGDWSELESGATHWLPAYGFQQPSDLQELLQQERTMEFFAAEGGPVSAQLFLETILEETSDDLRSESSCSGWPDTDSDTASVIHVVHAGVSLTVAAESSGSERDLAVPCKRRRRHNTDPGVHDDEGSDDGERAEGAAASRSSSLLQFETLERHCLQEDVWRTTATSEPLPPQHLTHRRGSPFSFDSLEATRWRFGSRDSLDSVTSSSGSSDADTLNRSFSSRSGHGSFRSSGLRSSRSYDSLVLPSDKTESSFLGGELSQSLNNTCCLPPDEPEPAPAPRGIYKTVECLNDVDDHIACGRRSEAKAEEDKPEEEGKEAADGVAKGERSAENLSEDSGFGEHLSSCNLTRRADYEEQDDESQREPRGWEGSDARAKYSRVSWLSAPDLAEPRQCDRDQLYPFTGPALIVTYKDAGVEESTAPQTEAKMATSRRAAAAASTPNLYAATEEFLANERRSLVESTTSLSHGRYASSSRLSGVSGSSRGSNIMITTSFVNLASNSRSNSIKGVHFCPVVSEVSWPDSGSDEDDEEEEEETRSRTESERSTPPFDQLVRESPAKKQLPRPQPRPEDGDERRRVIDELHKLKLEKEKAAGGHVTGGAGGKGQGQASAAAAARATRSVHAAPSAMDDRKKKHGLGGFLQRFSFRRLSGREKKKEKKKYVNSSTTTSTTVTNNVKVRDVEEDFKIIPLHGPSPPAPDAAAAPKLPPAQPPPARHPQRPSAAMATATAPRHGLLETDLDSDLAPATKKTRSLLNLDDGRATLKPCPVQREDSRESDSRAKSMEFLLDKENQAAIQPPENELQKVGVGERVMSEHQLRVQRSLQKLNVPEWYRNSTLPAQGFLLKRNSDAGLSGGGAAPGWQGLNNKTTSLSSLGSTQSTPRSPSNSHAQSPSPTAQVFSRWSTSRLSSTSTSPCGSTRSSFNYRQPYLGWRSQERLSHPRTPAERLAADILANRKQESVEGSGANLSDVRSSIKEVTSAIVHYVSGTRDSADRLSPALRDTSSSRSGSPRGSTGRLCWLESSFVGSRPLDVPETPASATTPSPLYHPPPPPPNEYVVAAPDPRSATMEDVLDSLLGLPPASRSPSPSSPSLAPPDHSRSHQRRSCGDLHQESASSGGEGERERRHSEGFDSKLAPRARRVSFEAESNGLVRCRYSKCGKTSSMSDARRTFKTCHNCAHVYCSRECRRAHWEKHRKTCLHSRVGALCRRVLSAVKEDSETLHHVSLLARRGFLARGRGAVKSFFSSPENAERFVSNGLTDMGEPTFVRWADLLPDEMGPELYKELLRLCKSYNPDTRLVLYVAVCVVSEVPTSGAVKWERQLVSRCAKLRLSRPLVATHNITRDLDDPETLILTSLPGVGPAGPRARQVSFTNIQRHLRQRGVSLRKQFPEVYQRLCAYVEGSSERFTPVTIYPRDSATGKSFMCIIMPDAEPEKLELLPKDSARVQTVDISQEAQQH